LTSIIGLRSFTIQIYRAALEVLDGLPPAIERTPPGGFKLYHSLWTFLAGNTNLQELTLYEFSGRLDINTLGGLRFPHLKSFILWSQLPFDDSIRTTGFLNFVQAHPSSTSLTLPAGRWGTHFPSLRIHLPFLDTLSAPSSALFMFEPAGTITELNIAECHRDKDVNVLRSASRFSRLKALHFYIHVQAGTGRCYHKDLPTVYYMGPFSTMLCGLIEQTFPNLEKLSVVHQPGVLSQDVVVSLNDAIGCAC